MKKIDIKDDHENTIVHVTFLMYNGIEYECVGVLMKDEEDFIQVAFNAKNNVVCDNYDIKKSWIISMDILDSSKIEKI